MSEKITGVVKWLNRDEGVGYVVPDRGIEDVFCSFDALYAHKEALAEGQRVEFAIEDSEDGPKAKDVRPL